MLHRLGIIDVAQRAGLSLEEIRQLTGPQQDGHDAAERIRALAERKLPHTTGAVMLLGCVGGPVVVGFLGHV